MKLLALLLLLIIFICHCQQVNGQDTSGSGEIILPVLSIGFEQSAYTYYESRQESNRQICVSASQQSAGITAVVEVTITSDTAQGGIDYVINNTQLVINEVSVRECISIIIIDDDVSEGGEMLQAYLSLVGVANNSTMNNDSTVPVVLTVDQANITIYDSVGFSEVPLSQTVLLNSVAVSFTCVSTPDFQSFEIFWSINGRPVNVEQTPPGVQIMSEIDEKTGALSSTLIVPTTLGYDNARVVCTLVSEGQTSVSDAALLQLQFVTLALDEDMYVVIETDGTLTPFIIALDSNLPEGTNVTVNVSTAPDLALGRVDYVPFTGIISLIEVSPGSRISLTIMIIDDNNFEPEETFFLLLNALSPGVLINTSMAIVIIMDDDVHIGVGFDPVSYNVSEGEMVTLRVILNATTNQTITVDLLTRDGSAVASMDYETVTRTLTFSNSTEQIVPILIITDEVTENVESFTAWLINPAPMGSAFITTPTATINIIDQEVAVVRFSSNEYIVRENDQNVQLGIQLLTVAERQIIVTLTIEPGSAQSPEDYTSQETVPVTLDSESSQVFVPITIIDDNVYDGTKVFYATISSQSERVFIVKNRTRVVITDNEVVYVWFNPIGYYVSEDTGIATLTIERIGANGIPVNISVTTQDINATAGVDYELLSEEVTIFPSLEQLVSFDLNVTVIDDASVTGEVKQFQASLNTSQEGVLFTSDNQTAIVNILDNDSFEIEIGFQKAGYAVSESHGSVAPIIVVEGNVSTPFDVIITSINETASLDHPALLTITLAAPRDYELLQSLLTINPGTSTYQIDIAIFENDDIELSGFKSFSLVLSTTEGSVLFTNRTTVITIYDNDFSAPVVTVSNVSATVIDGQPVNFTCNVTTPVNGVSVAWLDGNGDVISNSTYTTMGYNVVETIAGDSIITVLMVSSFSLSEYIQGTFSCVGRVGNLFEERVADSDTPPITSQLAAPSVNIILFPFSSHNITAGQNITVQCAISTDYGRPTDIEVTPHILWDIYYENNGERVMSSFEATELISLTSAVFLSSLEYAPVVSMRNFTCRSYVEPTIPNNRILMSETGTDSRVVSAQAPMLSVTIDPQPAIIITDVPPYNNYTLTCNATIPMSLAHLQVSFSIYHSSTRNVIASANYTPIDDCQPVRFIGDRLCTFVVTFAEVANISDASERVCLVELLYIDSGTSEVVSIARENASVRLLINVPGPPALIMNYHVYGVSTELAILHWIVPRIAYTPETYYIQYRLSTEGGSDVTFTSLTIDGSSDLSAQDIEYSIVLDGLNSGTFYVANIVANNTFGGQVSPDILFVTNPLDIYRVVSDMDDTVPLGAHIAIEFRFNGEGIASPISESTQLTFYPLFHVPAIEPTNIIFNGEWQQVTVSYNHVSPSLSGEYVLCQEAGPPPSRRRRGVVPEQRRPRFCGGRVMITVTIPTLSVSTNLLIEQYVANSYVGGSQPPFITCLPSDTRAPVRWRLSTGVYGDLSDDYLVMLSPPTLNHTATFPVAYETLPSRSAFYICDLINVELSAGLEVSPQNVTVRFIQGEVAILNNDMELLPGAVINQFHIGHDSPEPFLSLNCLSTRDHQNLEWLSRDVLGLLPDGPISSLSSPNVLINYFPESDSQQRDVVLTVNPITEGLTGYYSCRSRQSGISAEVYTTITNPLWLHTTPTWNYIAIGTFLPVISVLYADISFGYQNLGSGFSYSLTFEPYSSEPDMMLTPDQNNGSQPDSLQRSSNNRVTLISGLTTNLIGNNLTYLITGELARFDGRYQLNATHLSSGTEYSDTVDVQVIVPFFTQVDELVYSRIGDFVTLMCLPNDTMATVYWMRLTGGGDTVIITSDANFTLSPPQQNYQIMFNATSIVTGSIGDDLSLQDRTYVVACAFVNGDNTSNLISPMNLTVQLQEEQIRMITSPLEVVIRNNTVVNRFTTSERVVGSANGESAPDLDLVPVGSLVVNCTATQGDHQPIWRSDNLAISDGTGAVISDMGMNGQVVTSNYTARLQLGLIDRQIEGNYFCRSQLSNLFTTFLLSTENPYIRAVSPTQLTITEGESVTLIFLIATDSDGATWNNEAVTFSFTNRSGVEYFINSNFQDPNPDFPQYFMYTIPRVELSDAGIYTASAPRRDCSTVGESDMCGITSASIDMTVRTYCQEQIIGGIQWPRTESDSEVSRACNIAGSRFRRGTFTTRRCSETGVWSDIDLSTCTLVADSPPFLLISFVIETEDEISSLDDYSYLEAEMENLLRNRRILFTDVILQSSYFASISVTFEVTLTLPFTPAQNEQLVNFSNYFTTSLTMFGNFTLRRGNRSLSQVSAADACPCQPPSGSVAEAGLNIIELCSGVSISPCNCTSDFCQCSPPFLGDGVRCTLDSDGDGYPDVALIDSPVCRDSEGTQELFCIQDNCPMVINIDQDRFACDSDTSPVFDGCPFEIDNVWGITWPNTERNSTNSQLCPGGYDALGTAMRYCNNEGQWEEANVLECTTLQFINLEELARVTVALLDPEEQIMQSAELTQQLIEATEPQNRSLLPNDLQASTRVLTTVLKVLENNENATTDLNVIDIFDNMLDISQMDGWRTLQMAGLMNGSEMLLNNAERYGLLVASSVNGSGDDRSAIRQSRSNIVVTGNQYREPPASAVRFPIAPDLVNYTKGSMDSTQISIPPSLIQERMTEMDDSVPLPVSFLLIRDIPMGAFISNSTTVPATTCMEEGSLTTMAVSDVVAAQVGMGSNQLNPSQMLQSDPISLDFSFSTVANGSLYRCVYWNFSEPIGSGSWVIAGVTTTDIKSSGNQTAINCTSTHLTSFAVLVDVAGGLADIPDPERTALQIVSYIGCAISIICLIGTVLFFLFQGNKLKTSVHYFVHLNLALSLLLAFIVFVVGLETAIGSTGGCAFVAALLHYLFLSAFCWMLCEGIMLYLLLIVVFSKMSKKWWPFLLIGYLPPLPIVAITVGVRHQYYGVRDNCGQLLYCWLSVEQGTIFGFVAPMLAIILVNVVFLIMALYALVKTKKRQLRRKRENDEATRKTAKAILTASVVLLPLLGLTWAFGILTVNVNTTVFAWLFTIFNSLQGAFIFFFHVVRSDQVWSKVNPRLQSLKRSTFRSTARWYDVSSTGTSTLSKGSTMKSTLKGHFGSISRDPNSTLGCGDSYKKADISSVSQLSTQIPSSYELKTDLSPVSEAEEIGTETETKVDLSIPEKSTSNEDGLIPESSVSPKDDDKLIVKERNNSVEVKVDEAEIAVSSVIVNPVMISEEPEKGTVNSEKCNDEAKMQTHSKNDNEN